MNMQEMEKRLLSTEATLEIINMHNEYVFYLNQRQWRKMADCFTADATADIHEKRQGRENIYQLFKDVISQKNASGSRDVHFAVQPVITVNGDTARGHWLMYIFISDAASGSARRWISGRYDAEYAKENGKWMFKALIYSFPWPE